jgi:hypothetical protein
MKSLLILLLSFGASVLPAGYVFKGLSSLGYKKGTVKAFALAVWFLAFVFMGIGINIAWTLEDILKLLTS